MAIKTLICESCGAKINLDDNKEFGFCEYCGTKIMLREVIEVKHTGLDPAEKKAEHIAKLSEYMSFLQDKDTLTKRLASIDVEKRDEQELLKKKTMRTLVGCLILLLVMRFYIIIPLIAVAGVLGLYYKKNQDFPDFIMHESKRIDELDKERILKSRQLREMVPPKALPIGEQYCNIATLKALIGYMRDGRADTMKEAINLYEAAKEKAEMQRMYNEIKKVNQNLLNSNAKQTMNGDGNLVIRRAVS